MKNETRKTPSLLQSVFEERERKKKAWMRMEGEKSLLCNLGFQKGEMRGFNMIVFVSG